VKNDDVECGEPVSRGNAVNAMASRD